MEVDLRPSVELGGINFRGKFHGSKFTSENYCFTSMAVNFHERW